MHVRVRGSKSLQVNSIKPDFPSLADEIAEPHPDMHIKVAAFTVSEKSSNITHHIRAQYIETTLQCTEIKYSFCSDAK